MLSLQTVELVQSLLHLLDATRLGVDPVEVGTQPACDVVELQGGRADSLGQFVKRGIEALHARQLRLRPRPAGHGRRGGVIGRGDPRQRCGRGGSEPLDVAKALARCLELALLVGVGRSRLDLGELVAKQVQIPLPRTLAGSGARRARAPAPPPRRAPPGTVPGAPGAQDRRSRRGSRAGPRRAPACDARAGRRRRAAARSKRPQVARRRASPLHEGAGATAGADAPPKGDLGGPVGEALLELRELRVVRTGRPARRRRPRRMPRPRPGARSAASPCRPSGGRANARGSSCPPRSPR